jgi:lipoprotein-anchoring transpeptidase ErfK/SrfK
MHFGRKWIYLAAAPVIAITVPGSMRLFHSDTTATRGDIASSPLRMEADLSSRRLRLYENDTLVVQYPVSVGQPRYPTPPGKYLIKQLTWNPSWTPPPDAQWAKKYSPQPPGAPANPMKVAKIFFRYPDYYIHGTGDINSLGNAESHGCLRMDPEHVAEVARFVMEHGGQPRSENWFWRIVHFRSEEKTIYLDNPIPLIVSE